MIAQCEGAAFGTAAATLAAIGIYRADGGPEADIGEADCELRLWISDGFTRQAWMEAGERWTETRDTVVFHDDEVARITITNDRPGTRVVSLGRRLGLMRLRPGETRSLTLRIEGLDSFDIAVVGEPMISRPAEIRPRDDAGWDVAFQEA
jgi:hypothetical protein